MVASIRKTIAAQISQVRQTITGNRSSASVTPYDDANRASTFSNMMPEATMANTASRAQGTLDGLKPQIQNAWSTQASSNAFDSKSENAACSERVDLPAPPLPSDLNIPDDVPDDESYVLYDSEGDW